MLQAAMTTSTNKTLLRRRLMSLRGSCERAMRSARRVAMGPERRVRCRGRLRCGPCSGVHCGLSVQMLAGSARSRRALQRRLGEWPAHRPERTTRRCRRALQRVELAAEVGHRRVRVILDPIAEHRWDEHGSPCSGDDEEYELS